MLKQLIHNKYLRFISLNIVTIFGCLLLSYLWQPNNPALLGSNVNPLWYAPVIIGAYYGFLLSFVSSALCIATSLLMIHLQTDYLQVETIFVWQNLAPLSVILFLSSIMGEFRDRSMAKIRELKNENSQNKSVISHLNEVLTVREKESREYQNRLVNKTDTVKSLFEQTKIFNSLEIKELFKNFQELLQNDLKVQKFELYFGNQSQHPEKVIDHDMFGGSEYELSAPTAAKLTTFLQTNNRVYSLPEIEQIEAFSDVPEEAILIGPLVVNGRVLGVAVIYEMPFLMYTLNNIKLFDIYLDWLGRSVFNAQKYNRVSFTSILNEEFGVYKFSYFLERLEEEFEQSKNYMIPMALMHIHIDDFEEIKPARRSVVKKILVESIGELIRKTDCLALDENLDRLNILMPLADEAHVQKLKLQIEQRIARYQIKINDSGKVLSLEIKQQNFTADTESAQVMLDQVRRA